MRGAVHRLLARSSSDGGDFSGPRPFSIESHPGDQSQSSPSSWAAQSMVHHLLELSVKDQAVPDSFCWGTEAWPPIEVPVSDPNKL